MSNNNENVLAVLRLLLAAFIVLILVIALNLVLVIARANAAATSIHAGYPQLNGGQPPLWNIPESKSIDNTGLSEPGLDFPGGGVRLTESAVSGSVDVALTTGAAMNAMPSGADL